MSADIAELAARFAALGEARQRALLEALRKSLRETAGDGATKTAAPSRIRAGNYSRT